MTASGFGCLLLLILTVAAFVNLRHLGRESSSLNPGMGNVLAETVKTRKLKDNTDPHTWDQPDASSHVSSEDYRAIDPVPTSKTSIRHGPIQHDTPLMPYIPIPSSPPSSGPENNG